jgi:hypothetical protein
MTVTITATPSTSLLTDLASLNHPTDLTLINSRELPDLDYLGMLSAATQALCQAKNAITDLLAATDSADGNAAVLANILASLT